MKKITTIVTLLLILSFAVVSVSEIGLVKAEGTIYIRADGNVEGTNKIQRDGNIYTFTGDIFDSIVVEKDDVVIDGVGYSLKGDGSGYGIHLIHRNYVTIRNLEIEEFDTGIRLYGGSNNTINENNMVNNEWGIYVEYSENNTLSKNNVTENEAGIRITLSSNNILRNNRMKNNRYNFGVSGANLLDYVNDIDTSNTIDEKPVYYWVNEQEKAVPLDAGHVVLVNCTGITVKNLNLTNNTEGILLAFTKTSTITQNTITNNGAGINLRGSSSNNTISGNIIINNEGNGVIFHGEDNKLFGNTITNNGNYGILLYFSHNNTIYGNNITANELGIYLYGSTYNNISGNSLTTNIEAGLWFFGSSHNNIVSNNVTDNQISMHFEVQFLNNTIYHNNFINNDIQFFPDIGSVSSWDNGVEGNYWSNYNGTDDNGDGIGDTPYVIAESNQDNYPLIEPVIIPEFTPKIMSLNKAVQAVSEGNFGEVVSHRGCIGEPVREPYVHDSGIRAYLLWIASNGTLYQAEYPSGEILGQYLENYVFDWNFSSSFYVWDLDYGNAKTYWVEATNGTILRLTPQKIPFEDEDPFRLIIEPLILLLIIIAIVMVVPVIYY